VSVEENKELVRRFYREVINERNVDAIDDLLTEDFVHKGDGRGREGQKPSVKMFLAGFSDLHDEVELVLAEGDLVAAHQTWTGIHDGEFLRVPATGEKVSFESTAVLRIADGLIAGLGHRRHRGPLLADRLAAGPELSRFENNVLGAGESPVTGGTPTPCYSHGWAGP
jgi:predicted ester cyclase